MKLRMAKSQGRTGSAQGVVLEYSWQTTRTDGHAVDAVTPSGRSRDFIFFNHSSGGPMLYYRDLKIKLHPQVYEPAEDTFLLAENLMVKDGDFALDMGTGTGIIALLMAKKAKFVLGVDVNPIAVELAKENARLNGIINVEFKQSDLFQNVGGKFNIITFNAPYLPGESEEPIDLALVGGREGREVLDRFIEEVNGYLTENGIIQIVQSSITGVDKTIEKLTSKGFKVEITGKERYFFEEIVLITAKRVGFSEPLE